MKISFSLEKIKSENSECSMHLSNLFRKGLIVKINNYFSVEQLKLDSLNKIPWEALDVFLNYIFSSSYVNFLSFWQN